jgi:hypothetical protein
MRVAATDQSCKNAHLLNLGSPLTFDMAHADGGSAEIVPPGARRQLTFGSLPPPHHCRPEVATEAASLSRGGHNFEAG